jgi:hypothetical protein
MKPRFAIPFLLLAAACGGSSAPPEGAASSPPPTTMVAAPSPMGPSIVAEVVMIDTAAPSVTLREGDVPATRSPKSTDLKATDRTIRVEPSGAASLSGIKPGDRVRVTCSAPRPVVVTDASPMGTASPGSATSSPGGMASASPRMAGTTASALPAGPTGALAQCDSVVAITPLTASPTMTPAP